MLSCLCRQQPGRLQQAGVALTLSEREYLLSAAPCLASPADLRGKKDWHSGLIPHLIAPGHKFVLQFVWQARKELEGFYGCFTVWRSRTKRGWVSSLKKHFPSEISFCSHIPFFSVCFSGVKTAPGRDVGELYQGSVGVWNRFLPKSICTYKK